MKLTDTFSALGDPTRMAIVDRLLSQGALAAGDLSDVADISAPALSRHLKVLRQAGLLTRTVDRQRRIYAVNPEALRQVNAWMISHEDFWNSSLDRLAAALDEEET